MPTTLYKLAAIGVFPLHDAPEADCVLRRLLADQPWRADIDWPEGFAGGIAHRLDNDTSGALLVADSLEELEVIRRCFAEHRFTKRYLLRSSGHVDWDTLACDRPLAHDKKKRDRMTVQRGPRTQHRGKWYPAETEFQRVSGPIFRATMRSGIMHQIRAHAAFVGIPIDGDPIYGTPADHPFRLHHEGLIGPGELRTQPVPVPEWAN